MAGRTVTRADLADAVYRLGVETKAVEPAEALSRDDSATLVEDVLQAIMDSVVVGETVKLSSFGSFVVRDKSERIGRNPKTGEEAVISSRRVLTFRASHVLKDRLNHLRE